MAQIQNPITRVILIVLDGVGCGELPDAARFGDIGSNTLKHVSEKYTPGLKLPTLQTWGLGNLTPMKTVSQVSLEECAASFGKCNELSEGKDTTAGHWEMAGVVTEKAFATFPQGFSKEIVDRWISECAKVGVKFSSVLGNKTASGTEIIKELGEEHMHSGKPILYTSADSVWQIAAHEESFGLENLYKVSKAARKICEELNISRVIARPFVGKNAQDFKRTHHRKDYSLHPPEKTMMEILLESGFPVCGVGKIWNIFDGAGIEESIETIDNEDGMTKLIALVDRFKKGLIFVNLIDFDMNYGHRRDIPGFATALMDFDQKLAILEKKLLPTDLVILTGDHGNDPSYRGTDHTREYVPFIAFQKNQKSKNIGVRNTFADIGATVIHALTLKENVLRVGRSIYNESN